MEAAEEPQAPVATYEPEPLQEVENCGNILIKHLHFRLTDAYGNVIPLHGAHVSFTLIFCPKD